MELLRRKSARRNTKSTRREVPEGIIYKVPEGIIYKVPDGIIYKVPDGIIYI